MSSLNMNEALNGIASGEYKWLSLPLYGQLRILIPERDLQGLNLLRSLEISRTKIPRRQLLIRSFTLSPR
ncbi:predicted protein [Sclerotinia sclerotiorum 1980 UF-70]|uniref:Uncharacterized protein n=1 Tax=Sclerotinia sclerotiorum (strain ATCC 18683 / 1980 / Ss-1) TaxID=665079 RepID=A7EI07_SCLS1|nr:predicted protein [Sclerotinia sclerotiorum 1980 UF-70]EDO02473.1 predicted protein [Sclerotinia sclerotiorum 1980 UF-70]